MKEFAQLFTRLDQTTKTSVKTEALAQFFREAPETDRLWAVALFSGRRPKRAVTTTDLRLWAAEEAGIPLWLFEEAYPIVGDLAETISLVLPPAPDPQEQSLTQWILELRGIARAAPEKRRAGVLAAWARQGTTERFLFNKLITGGFRIGVSRKLMTRALAQATGRDEAALALRLMGTWDPEATTWAALTAEEDAESDASRPYPFCLASPLEDPPESLGDLSDWLAEWKWDGIRGQLLLRGGTHHLWSRGEDLITDSFPELARAADFLPQGTVIDGEILVWGDGAPRPFAALQARLGRKTVPKKLLAEAPVRLLAYDLLEDGGEDLRAAPLSHRRARLAALLDGLPDEVGVNLSPAVTAPDWAALARLRSEARERRAEGLMLKRLASPYRDGRRRGDWWKWKLDPLSVDAVMIYAQQGHGRRANLFTDFTFAVRDGEALVPFTKAYSGLTDAEFAEITTWVRRHTQARFGPVRQVTPDLVFEIAFEGIQASPRHKSGIALRFPRMARWRRDKPASEVDTLEGLRALLARYG